MGTSTSPGVDTGKGHGHIADLGPCDTSPGGDLSLPTPSLSSWPVPSSGTPVRGSGPSARLRASFPELIISLALRQALHLKRFLHIKN